MSQANMILRLNFDAFRADLSVLLNAVDTIIAKENPPPSNEQPADTALAECRRLLGVRVGNGTANVKESVCWDKLTSARPTGRFCQECVRHNGEGGCPVVDDLTKRIVSLQSEVELPKNCIECPTPCKHGTRSSMRCLSKLFRYYEGKPQAAASSGTQKQKVVEAAPMPVCQWCGKPGGYAAYGPLLRYHQRCAYDADCT